MVGEFKFASVPSIRFGSGVFSSAAGLVHNYGRSLLLVTGSHSFTSGEAGRSFIKELNKSGVNIDIVNVDGEPHAGFIDSIVASLRGSSIDLVMAAGGGSVLDAGKALAAMLTVSGKTWEYLEGNPGMKPHPGTRLPLIAVPTTAGTGSEATKNAVLTTPGEPRYKRSLRHENFVPDIAIVDPLLAKGCPPAVTAASGLDAITQLLEAFVSTGASPLTDALAESGLQKAFGSIIRAVDNGNDTGARSGMAYAALLSGIVLASAGLGAVHGYASVLGGYYDIPHGVICGTLLGSVTRANIQKLRRSGSGDEYLEKYSAAGRLMCAEKDKDKDYYLDHLADELDRLIEALELPRLGSYGIKPSDVPVLAAGTGIKNNPVQLGRSDLEEILHTRI